ncbi:MAG: nitroreductase family protein [Thermoplasmata archaeon]
MDIIDAIKGRRSVRNFTDEDVDEDTIRKLIELGNLAPSAGNLQARDFVVVRDAKKRALLAEASRQSFVSKAPVVLVVCANKERIIHYGERGINLYSVQDASAAVENILLAAHSFGLGTCWVGAFSEEKVAKVLSLPKHVRPVAIIPIGHYSKKPEPTSRIEVDKLMHIDGW